MDVLSNLKEVDGRTYWDLSGCIGKEFDLAIPNSAGFIPFLRKLIFPNGEETVKARYFGTTDEGRIFFSVSDDYLLRYTGPVREEVVWYEGIGGIKAPAVKARLEVGLVDGLARKFIITRIRAHEERDRRTSREEKSS